MAKANPLTAFTPSLPQRLVRLLSLAGLVLMLSACGSTPEFIADIDKERPHYTQVGMWADEGTRVMGTNYQRGVFIPINTEVRIHEVNAAHVVFSAPDISDDRRIRMSNVPGHTQVDMGELFQRTFATGRVDMGQFSADMRDNIRSGSIEKGMTRDEVIATRGYPPGHETPSLEAEQWRYWVNRFATNIVRFEGDKVAEIIR